MLFTDRDLHRFLKYEHLLSHVASKRLYLISRTEELFAREKISFLARRNFELLLTRIHGALPRDAVDDGESSLSPTCGEHIALNFPGRLSHLECTGSTKVNRRLVAENNVTAALKRAAKAARTNRAAIAIFERQRSSFARDIKLMEMSFAFFFLTPCESLHADGCKTECHWAARSLI